MQVAGPWTEDSIVLGSLLGAWEPAASRSGGGQEKKGWLSSIFLGFQWTPRAARPWALWSGCRASGSPGTLGSMLPRTRGSGVLDTVAASGTLRRKPRVGDLTTRDKGSPWSLEHLLPWCSVVPGDRRKWCASCPGHAHSVWGCIACALVSPLPLKEASGTFFLGDQPRGCFGRWKSGHRAKEGRGDLGNGRANGCSFCWEGKLLQVIAPPDSQLLPFSYSH